jgi:hypothetical protein
MGTINPYRKKQFNQTILPNRDSVPKCKIVPYPLEGAVHPQVGIKRLSDLHELGAKLVNLTRYQKRPHLQEKDMPAASHVKV